MTGKTSALIIDEDKDIRLYFIKQLSRFGIETQTVETAEEGIDALQKNSYDFVIASLCVRTMGARSIARWVKLTVPKTRFYIITSWKGDLEKNILETDGIHGVMKKPLIYNEIQQIIGDFLPDGAKI